MIQSAKGQTKILENSAQQSAIKKCKRKKNHQKALLNESIQKKIIKQGKHQKKRNHNIQSRESFIQNIYAGLVDQQNQLEQQGYLGPWDKHKQLQVPQRLKNNLQKFRPQQKLQPLKRGLEQKIVDYKSEQLYRSKDSQINQQNKSPNKKTSKVQLVKISNYSPTVKISEVQYLSKSKSNNFTKQSKITRNAFHSQFKQKYNINPQPKMSGFLLNRIIYNYTYLKQENNIYTSKLLNQKKYSQQIILNRGKLFDYQYPPLNKIDLNPQTKMDKKNKSQKKLKITKIDIRNLAPLQTPKIYKLFHSKSLKTSKQTLLPKFRQTKFELSILK